MMQDSQEKYLFFSSTTIKQLVEKLDSGNNNLRFILIYGSFLDKDNFNDIDILTGIYNTEYLMFKEEIPFQNTILDIEHYDIDYFYKLVSKDIILWFKIKNSRLIYGDFDFERCVLDISASKKYSYEYLDILKKIIQRYIKETNHIEICTALSAFNFHLSWLKMNDNQNLIDDTEVINNLSEILKHDKWRLRLKNNSEKGLILTKKEIENISQGLGL
ncbi:MAG: hypothetical protein ACTSQE_10925 [Candidatus Heimdallarchaeaceae archaeon]